MSATRIPNPNTGTKAKRLYTVEEVADYLSLSVSAIRKMIWRGELDQVKINRRVLIDIRDVDKLIDSCKEHFSY